MESGQRNQQTSDDFKDAKLTIHRKETRVPEAPMPTNYARYFRFAYHLWGGSMRGFHRVRNELQNCAGAVLETWQRPECAKRHSPCAAGA
jgi:hypothetical protein